MRSPSGGRRLPVNAQRLRIVGSVLLFVAFTALTIQLAYSAMFTRFYEYDDEGFHLLSLRLSMTEGNLYEGVFAQYGPFYYQVMGVVFRLLGTLPTHDSGRMVTLVLWVASSVLMGWATFRITRNLLLGFATHVMVFLVLFSLPNEPMHPGGLLVFLLSGIVWVIAFVMPRRRSLGLFLVGALISCLALTKVNVGGFAVISLAFAATVLFPVLAKRTAIRALAGLLFVGAPYLLMLRDLDQPWARRFALLVSLSALAVVIASSWLPPVSRASTSALWWLLAGLATPAVIVAAVVILQGTSVGGFVDGFLINALNQPDVFSSHVRSPPWALVPGGLSLALAITAAWRARTGRLGGLFRGIVAMAGGLLIWLGLLGPVPFSTYTFWLALPLVWVAFLTEPSRDGEMSYVLIPSIAVLQILHMYPVAGSQVSWAVLMLLPVGAMAIAGGFGELSAVVGSPRQVAGLRMGFGWIPVVGFLVWVLVSAFPTLKGAVDAERIYPPLDLPGAHRLRFSPELVANLKGVTQGLRDNCSTFISLPGLNSFYLFAEQDPPTTMNQSGWMYVFDSAVQQQIVQEIKGIDDLCLLRNPGVTVFWQQGRPVPRRPLVTYIGRSFVLFRSWGPWELLLPAPARARA